MSRGREVGFINVSVYGSARRGRRRVPRKGWLVAVDGRLEYGEWETERRRRHDYAVVGNVEFLSAPRVAEAQEPEAAKPARAARKKQEPVAA